MINKEGKNKAWIDKEGILVIKIEKILISEDAFELISEGEKLLGVLEGKGKILIEVSPHLDSFLVNI